MKVANGPRKRFTGTGGILWAAGPHANLAEKCRGLRVNHGLDLGLHWYQRSPLV